LIAGDFRFLFAPKVQKNRFEYSVTPSDKEETVSGVEVSRRGTIYSLPVSRRTT
jgi:hypothetical protein